LPIPVRGDRITAVSAPAQYCLLVTGMPGAGKSTITQLVAERLARSARIDADFVTMLIVRGGVWALGEPADEAARQVALKDQNVSSLAANFAAAGFTPVLDSVIPTRAQIEFYVRTLAPLPVALVVLAPGADICRYRNSIRPPEARFDFDGYAELDAQMRSEYGDLGWWFDTATLTPHETADRIVAEARGRALAH
jgi:predicted kinase